MTRNDHDRGDPLAPWTSRWSATRTWWSSARMSAISAASSACTQGLQQKYGKSRCFDAPISERGIVGTAIGMAAYGLRPCVEVQFADYIYPAYDQIVSEAARLRYRSDGGFTCPIVVRMPTGGGIFGGQTHSQSPEALFTHVCGLKMVVPSNPYDAKGLLIAAIEDPRSGDLPRAEAALQRPVRRPSRSAGDAVVQASDWARCRTAITRVPLGKAAVRRAGQRASPSSPTAPWSMSRRRRRRRPASTPRSSICARLLPLDLEAIVASV